MKTIFGKSIENPMSKFDIRIVSVRPTFKTKKQLDNGLIIKQKDKCRIKLKKPTHIEGRILELSKSLMYDLHCQYIKNKNDKDHDKAE